VNKNIIKTREDGNYSHVLPLKAARHDSISNLTFLGLRIWTTDKPNTMPFYLESLWGPC